MLGIGWRPELAWMIHKRKDIEFVEILAENFAARGERPTPINQLIDRGVDVVVHGTTLSLGGSELPSTDALKHLGALATLYKSSLVSEHLAFVRAGKMESGHLLPLLRTQESLEIVVENILIAQKQLPVPLALENIASLFEWPGNEMDEATFVAEVISRTGALLLLDVANLYANSVNHGFDCRDYLRKIPADKIAYIHVAGGLFKGGLYHDTHCHSVKSPVLELLRDVCQMVAAPQVLLERDGSFPPEQELYGELDLIAAIAGASDAAGISATGIGAAGIRAAGNAAAGIRAGTKGAICRVN